MGSFSFYLDPQRSLKGNLIAVCEAVGKQIAEGASALTEIRNGLVGSAYSGTHVLSQLGTLGTELRNGSDKLSMAIDRLQKVIETLGERTLSSEVVQQMREENVRLERSIVGLQQDLVKQAAEHKLELERRELVQTLLPMPSEQIRELLQPILEEIVKRSQVAAS